MQGEYDALQENKALNYQTNLGFFIGDVRNALHAPQLPFCIGMIDSSPKWPYQTLVRKAELSVSQSLNGVSIFDTHGLGTDGIHYNTSGQIELGHLVFSTLNQTQVNCFSCSTADGLVFPNPASDYFLIENYGDIPGDYPYMLLDITGKEVLCGQLFAGNRIDISCLTQGTYFMFLQTNKKTLLKKIIKM